MTKDLDFVSLTIEKAIIHDLPKHYKKPKDDESVEPRLSKKESKMSPFMRSFFKEKMIGALKGEKSFKVCYDKNHSSPVSWLVGDLIENDKVFVEKTHLIAHHLFKVQNGQNSGGILIVLLCKIKEIKTCVIFKLDKEQGAQLTENEESESFDIEEVRNLMLSDKTKIMKIALLTLKENFPPRQVFHPFPLNPSATPQQCLRPAATYSTIPPRQVFHPFSLNPSAAPQQCLRPAANVQHDFPLYLYQKRHETATHRRIYRPVFYHCDHQRLEAPVEAG